jgi:hypothetical protein
VAFLSLAREKNQHGRIARNRVSLLEKGEGGEKMERDTGRELQ